MQWMYDGEIVDELPEGVVGFVYLITNLDTGKKYIGKKLAQFKKTRPPLKGKSRKRHYKVESDWRDYWGSSDALLEDIQSLGKEKFTRQIIHYCYSKAETSYLEAREQFERRVLESTDYYNNNIQVRVHGSHILREQKK